METLKLITAGQYMAVGGALGISLFSGFAIGYAVKKIIMILIFGFGVFMLGLLALNYYGIIENINWSVFSGLFDITLNKATNNFNKFMEFVVNQFPKIGLAVLGFYLGFRK